MPVPLRAHVRRQVGRRAPPRGAQGWTIVTTSESHTDLFGKALLSDAVRIVVRAIQPRSHLQAEDVPAVVHGAAELHHELPRVVRADAFEGQRHLPGENAEDPDT